MANATKAANTRIINTIRPVRLTFTLPPIVWIKRVMTVPIVAPKTRKNAACNGTGGTSTPSIKMLEPTMPTSIPVKAELDCNSAVATAPINTNNSGKLTFVKKAWIPLTKSALLSTAFLIAAKPKNKMPKPVKISPMFLTNSFFINIKITPIIANTTKYLEILTEPNAASKPVTVVPTYAPKIILTPWKTVIAPAPIKPITMTPVAALL